jgi:hypothetical protein
MIDQSTPSRRRIIGVAPAHEHGRHARLLAALEAAYPVTFRPALRPEGLDGLLAFGADGELVTPGLPSLVMGAAEARAAGPQTLVLSGEGLPSPLRAARLSERHVVGRLGPAERGDIVLGQIGGAPVWLRRGHVACVAAAPAELEPGEALRDRLMPGRCLALLAVAEFLRERTAGAGWTAPPLRAAFVLDDPNLHWTSYGHIRYRDLLTHAIAHGYHVTMATVPLDGWLVHPGAARLFREGADHLSLCVHGNDHAGPELGGQRSDADALALAGQALQRTAVFERRARVPVSKVMIPPHERLSESVARALASCGYDAVCTTRPYPWSAVSAADPWLSRPADAGPLTGWGPVEIVAGGLPVLLRCGFTHPREELVLRAYLGQPLIVYGHHADLRDGLELLADVVGAIGRLGDVRWESLGAIARDRAETRLDGTVLHVRPLGRKVRIAVPDSVRELRVVPPDGMPTDGGFAVRPSGAAWSRHAGSGAAFDGPGELELALAAPVPRPAPCGSSSRPRVWPVARRLAGEGRDRLSAALA